MKKPLCAKGGYIAVSYTHLPGARYCGRSSSAILSNTAFITSSGFSPGRMRTERYGLPEAFTSRRRPISLSRGLSVARSSLSEYRLSLIHIFSQATVSLILNNSDKITFSNETKERVLAAAQKLNYRLPQRKKQREKKASNMLLVLTPTLTNQYYAELIQAIEDYADTLDYRVIAVSYTHLDVYKRQVLRQRGRCGGFLYPHEPGPLRGHQCTDL